MSHGHRTLSTEKEVEAYLHRTRMQMLAAMAGEAATISQIAARMGVHPANLTRHMRVLVGAGLATLVEKRDAGRNLEKYYRAVGRSFDVAPGSGALRAAHKTALSFLRSEVSAAIAQLPDEDPGLVRVMMANVRVREDQAAAFAKEVEALVARFNAADTEDGQSHTLAAALFPSMPADPQETTFLVERKAG